jgi:hypothetical protein
VVRSFVCSNSESIGLILNVDVSNLCLIKKSSMQRTLEKNMIRIVPLIEVHIFKSAL